MIIVAPVIQNQLLRSEAKNLRFKTIAAEVVRRFGLQVYQHPLDLPFGR
jgi:hypothetical protein